MAPAVLAGLLVVDPWVGGVVAAAALVVVVGPMAWRRALAERGAQRLAAYHARCG